MKILIAEDNPVSRRLLEKILEKDGHEVLSAEDGLKAFELFQKNEVSMVISDWMMPRMDGLALCRKIRSSAKENYTYIIVLTAKDQKQDLVKILNEGADDYLTKPCDRDEMRARLMTGERIINLQKKLQEAMLQVQAKNEKLEDALQKVKQTQAQILQSEKMSSIGQLAAGVAHEINNPIGFVSSNLRTLSDYQGDISSIITQNRTLITDLKETISRENLPSNVTEQVGQIMALETKVDLDFILADIPELIGDCQEGTERVKNIVLNLKDFAHPGEDKAQVTDLNKGLESTLNVVWNELKYKATVTKDYGELPLVKCYPQQLNQVFMNILVNAAQAIEDKGEIRIVTWADNGHVKVRISDTGKGIPPESISKIFDPFFTTKDVGKGTGLGLNVAYNIIQKHNANIAVESEVGKGTTFTIRLQVDPQLEKEEML